MRDRSFYGMFALALWCATMALVVNPVAVVFPAFMFFLIGFDSLASAMSAFGQDAAERLEAKPASAVDAEGSETPKGHNR